jgi:outer membrane protein
MMRSLALTLTLASGLVLSAAAQTPVTPAAAGPTKIAVIAFQAAVGQTNEFQRDFADLQKKFEPKRQELKTLSDEIDAQQKQLQTQGEKLSDSERATKTKDLDEKQKKAKRIAEDAQGDYQQGMQEIFGRIAAKVDQLMTVYAQQQGFTVVLDETTSQQQAPLLLYANPSNDITKAIVEAYNVKSGVPAPPAPAAAKPAPAGR